jgi:CRISPR-associated protein Cas5d
MLSLRLWRARMEDGLIRFPPPEDCDPKLRRDIRPMKKKEFGDGGFSGLQEAELDGLLKGGDPGGLDAAALSDL